MCVTSGGFAVAKRVRARCVALALMLLVQLVTGCASAPVGDTPASRASDHRVTSLDLSRKHRHKMAVITPGGEWLILVDKHASYSLMTEEELMGTDRLWLNANVKGTRYDNGTQVPVDVFTVPGKYTIVLTDNLETEPENMNAVTIDIDYVR